MAALTVTKTATIEPGQTLAVRSGFGIALDDGSYVLSNAGPGGVILALADSPESLPASGHPLFFNSDPFPIRLVPGGGGEPYIWLRSESVAVVAISPAP